MDSLKLYKSASFASLHTFLKQSQPSTSRSSQYNYKDMIIIRNNVIPFPGYKAVNVCGILFARKKANIDEVTLRHESIHSKQILEMLVVGFYLWYVIEWIVKFIKYRDVATAYRSIGFEMEAYIFEKDADYLKERPHYAWLEMV